MPEEEDEQFETRDGEEEEEKEKKKSDSEEDFNTSFSNMMSSHQALFNSNSIPFNLLEERQSFKKLCRKLTERFGSLFVCLN